MLPPSGSPPVGFVLSAGRTGTMYLTGLLAQQCPTWQVVHEPFPGRYELLLGNFRNDIGIGSGLARRIFIHSRRRRIRSLTPDSGYIEINPLLCPIIDLLPQIGRPLHVVHMVREPLSWARSIMTFRASRRIRPFFNYIPFRHPYPTPRPKGWRSLSPIERQLWRWRACNDRIVNQYLGFSSYEVIRYEDLFSPDETVRLETLKRISQVFGMGAIELQQSNRSDERVNAAPTKSNETNVLAANSIRPERVAAICGNLMKRFGYA